MSERVLTPSPLAGEGATVVAGSPTHMPDEVVPAR